ncbi:MAG TPA: DUF4097 family beta strand repeat-containing protein [Paludibaculum sp.]|jgi:DUF4097 and DUF4098 domain-containing protein YvlB
MRKLPFALLLAASTLLLTGCEMDPTDWGNSDRFREDFSSTHKLAPGGRVMLESFNGGVEIIGWEKDSVEVSGTKSASREDVMKEIRIDVVSEADSIRIRVIRPVEHNCNCGAKFVLKVPKKVILDSITTSNGGIRVESITGNSRLKTSNGGIRVWGVDGNLEATTSNASIEVGQFKGAADLRSSNGRIKADGIRGAFDARTSNASIDATVAELDPGRPLSLESSNGSITLTLDTWKSNDIKAHTSNSSVNVRLPDKVAADLMLSTSNGSITTDFEITTSQFSKTRVVGKLNGGGPRLDLSTSNGNVRLMKK